MTPDLSADTWLGAAGWASGNHTCSGTSPALDPKPTAASKNTAVRSVGESAGLAARRVAKLPSPDAPTSRKAPSRNDSPTCVMPMYQIPARWVSGWSDSAITRKYELTDMPSQSRRNVMMLSASGTRLMVRRNRFSIDPIQRDESPREYPRPYNATGKATTLATARKNAP